jgi:CheY-like chemotaxis protein
MPTLSRTPQWAYGGAQDDVKNHYPILLAEDNPDDAFFIQRAFHTAEIRHPLFLVADGQQAIDFMSGKGRYSDRSVYPLPQLVLCDLKMPGVSGFEVIDWMRKHGPTKLVPIVVLSSSALPQDVNHAYALGANAYMVKPADARALDRLFRTMAEFWLAGEMPSTANTSRNFAG